VTTEDAEVQILDSKHPLLNHPNVISNEDFSGWVQERGLYFPGEWDAAYTSVVATSDEGEQPLKGAILVAPYGEGHYIYTSFSWFRELPAGVPGAYRLFANMIAIGQESDK
jgi:hypothetical protein